MSADSQLVAVDAYDAAMAKLKASLPERFEFEIEDWQLRNHTFQDARRIANSLRTLENGARDLGYSTIDHTYVGSRDVWLYVFKRQPALKPKPAAIERDAAIDV